MGVMIYDRIKTDKKFIEIDGAGHNDIFSEYKSIYLNSILEFIQKADDDPTKFPKGCISG